MYCDARGCGKSSGFASRFAQESSASASGRPSLPASAIRLNAGTRWNPYRQGSSPLVMSLRSNATRRRFCAALSALRLWSRQNDSHSAAPLSKPVREFEGSAVRFRDLTGENKANTAARRFCCIEGNKRIARIQQARTVIFDGQVHNFVEKRPANNHGRLEPVRRKVAGFIWSSLWKAGPPEPLQPRSAPD